jgi:hypothetical protein
MVLAVFSQATLRTPDRAPRTGVCCPGCPTHPGIETGVRGLPIGPPKDAAADKWALNSLKKLVAKGRGEPDTKIASRYPVARALRPPANNCAGPTLRLSSSLLAESPSRPASTESTRNSVTALSPKTRLRTPLRPTEAILGLLGWPSAFQLPLHNGLKNSQSR